MAARRNSLRRIKYVFAAVIEWRHVDPADPFEHQDQCWWVGAIRKVLARTEELRLTWSLSPELDEEAALVRLFHPVGKHNFTT